MPFFHLIAAEKSENETFLPLLFAIISYFRWHVVHDVEFDENSRPRLLRQVSLSEL